jgi:hypothetical protein
LPLGFDSASTSEKVPSPQSNEDKIFHEQNRLNRQIQMSYEEKTTEKANLWSRYSIMNAELATSHFEELFGDDSPNKSNTDSPRDENKNG